MGKFNDFYNKIMTESINSTNSALVDCIIKSIDEDVNINNKEDDITYLKEQITIKIMSSNKIVNALDISDKGSSTSTPYAESYITTDCKRNNINVPNSLTIENNEYLMLKYNGNFERILALLCDCIGEHNEYLICVDNNLFDMLKSSLQKEGYNVVVENWLENIAN